MPAKKSIHKPKRRRTPAHKTFKITPKKRVKRVNTKAIKHFKRAKVSKCIFNKVSSMTVMLFVLLLIIITFTLRYMYDSTLAARNAYDAADHDANSFLAYTQEQIKVAGIVGDKKQLQSEIVGLAGAPEDLQAYVLKDYKMFKRDCIVNAALVSATSYDLISVVYDRYALVAKDCNGKQQSILNKISNKWVVIYSGNVTVPCSLVNDFGIPQGISRNCAENGVEYLNPNP